ncbi:helix-turn-helix domain-containing protein [Conexibacter woesei]|uniref:helix-turn-helix domain-containing protein n=1 Tax=Conexibacter woesei TaxID=191495 RepID=UPI0002E49EEA|nr:helix-turn-helix domain-containing protein [Conexibacter woesei]
MSKRGELDPDGGLSLDQLIEQIDTRLEALRPFVAEFEQLEAARAVLVADHGAGARRLRARASRGTAAQPRRARRAPRGANRAAILHLAAERPGITVAEIAQETGIGKPTVHSTVYALKRRGELENAGDGVKLAGGTRRESASRATPARRAAAGRARSHARGRGAPRARKSRRAAAPSAPARAPTAASTSAPDAEARRPSGAAEAASGE